MTNEETKVEAENAETEKEIKDTEPEIEVEEGNEPLNTGIEDALKAERELRLEAERKLNETRAKARERFEARQKEKEEEIDPVDEPITRQSVQEMLEEERESVRKEMRIERAVEIAKKISENPSEAELILEVWKNRTLSGTLEEQISEAQAIATFKRTRKVNDELKRALMAKDGVSYDNANAQRKPAGSNEPKINAVDKTVTVGMVWDSVRNAYKKPIAGGTKTYYVSRDLKKRWVEKV